MLLFVIVVLILKSALFLTSVEFAKLLTKDPQLKEENVELEIYCSLGAVAHVLLLV